jgi:hypothetical protein
MPLDMVTLGLTLVYSWFRVTNEVIQRHTIYNSKCSYHVPDLESHIYDADASEFISLSSGMPRLIPMFLALRLAQLCGVEHTHARSNKVRGLFQFGAEY